MPHAHPDCEAVAVYCLDPGEPNPIDPLDGILAFVDPRYKACCRAIDGYMTTPVMPNMKAANMNRENLPPAKDRRLNKKVSNMTFRKVGPNWKREACDWRVSASVLALTKVPVQ